MSRPASARFDWAGWRADVVDRLDRRSIGVAAAWVAVTVTLEVVRANDVGAVAHYALFKFSTVMVTLAILAVALVAVSRGNPAWVVYPAAGMAVAATC